MLKIDFLGNFYLQPLLSDIELDYLHCFSSSSHFYCPDDKFLGLYDISVSPEQLSSRQFHFNQDIDNERCSGMSHDDENYDSNVFPFLHCPLSFTEKSIKFSLSKMKNTDDFLDYIDRLSQSLLFYYEHFFKKNAYCQQINSQFFSFFHSHDFSGHIYFKLSQFGEIYKLTVHNNHISLLRGTYLAHLKGHDYHLSPYDNYPKNIERQLVSFYQNLSILDIKKNALFEEEGTIFSYHIFEPLNKLLHFHHLNNKLNHHSLNLMEHKIFKI